MIHCASQKRMPLWSPIVRQLEANRSVAQAEVEDASGLETCRKLSDESTLPNSTYFTCTSQLSLSLLLSFLIFLDVKSILHNSVKSRISFFSILDRHSYLKSESPL
jgi:hypothetical protein